MALQLLASTAWLCVGAAALHLEPFLPALLCMSSLFSFPVTLSLQRPTPFTF